MQAPMFAGEVFGLVQLTADRGEPFSAFHVCAHDTPKGAPIVESFPLRPMEPTEDNELFAPDENCEGTRRVLARTILCYFGFRSGTSAEPVIRITQAEQAASHAMARGEASTSRLPPTMRLSPTPQLQKDGTKKEKGESPNDADTAALNVPSSPMSNNNNGSAQPNNNAAPRGGKQRPLRTTGQFGVQVAALFKKDLYGMVASPCAACCELALPIFMVVLFGFGGLLQMVIDNSSPMNRIGYIVNDSAPAELVGEALPPFCGYSLNAPPYVNFSQYCPNAFPDANATWAAMMGPALRTSEPRPAGPSNTTRAVTFTEALDTTVARPWQLDINFLRTNPTPIAIALAALNANTITPIRTAISEFVAPFGLVSSEHIYARGAANGAIYLLIALLPIATRVTARLVDERREGMREHLRVMGCSDAAYVISTYGSTVLRAAPSLVIMTVLLRILWYGHLDSFLLFLCFFCLTLAHIAVALLMPAIFESSTWAIVITVGVNVPAAATSALITGAPFAVQIILCLIFPQVAAYYSLVSVLGGRYVDLDINLEASIMCLVGQAVVYALAGQYLARVFPGRFGQPQHPLYFLPCIGGKTRAMSSNSPTNGNFYGDTVITLKNIKKYFGDQRENPAVDMRSFSVNQGEILALLGHNGAGKTTLMQMLIGMHEATEYEVATLAGFDIGSQMDFIRLNVSVCPQFDVLFPTLGPRQHLNLFAALRGVDISRNRVDELLMFLDLPLDSTPAMDLSGGTRRRLSVACALVGDPAVIFLDEPTTGLDPVSRRKIWELLKVERTKGLTMVMTTHMMEEAETLGDRIAIMSYGDLHSVGTASQLKDAHGAGYFLVFSKTESFDPKFTEILVKEYCPSAVQQRVTAGEAIFFLPMAEKCNFANLFEAVEAQIEQTGASGFGLNTSTLEDVFVDIAENASLARAKAERQKLITQQQQEMDTFSASAVPIDDDVDNDDATPEDALKLEPFDAADERLTEQRFQESTELSLSKKVASDLFLAFKKRILFMRHLPSESILQVGIPLLLLVAAFAAVFSLKQQKAAKNDDLLYFEGLEPNNAGNMEIPIVYYGTDPAQNENVHRFKSVFERMYAAQYPGRVARLKITTFSDLSSGKWRVAADISYIPTSNPMVPPIAIVFNSFKTNGPLSSRSLDYSFAYNQKEQAHNREFAKSFLARLSLIAVSAVDVVAYNASGLATMNNADIKDAIVPINPKAFDERRPSSGTLPPEAAEGKPVRMTWACAIIFIIAVVFQQLPIMMNLSHEARDGIFKTMRAHGLSITGYWLGNYGYDLMLSLVFPFGLIIGVYVRDIFVLENWQLAGMFFATLLFCSTAILMTYTGILLFPRWQLNSHIYLTLGLHSIMFLVPYSVLTPIKLSGLKVGHPGYPLLESITPQFNFYTLLNDKRDFKSVRDPSGATHLIMFFVYNILLIAAIVALCYRGPKPNRYVPTEEGIPVEGFLDRDVMAEMSRVDQGGKETGRDPNSMIAGVRIWKKYDDGCVAVKGLTFGVRPGECFGLLGSNGAGKTTTMRMLQGEEDASGGDVTFGHLPPSFEGGVDEIYRAARMGICQQHEVLFEPLTATEHIEFYLKMRLGPLYDEAELANYVRCVVRRLQLDPSKPVSAMSGGMKRKLAVGVALYTGASIAFLDEPSSGLDPFARRLLWELIRAFTNPTRCVVITTHSMEEADAVCSRIAIVTEGHLRCLGSGQHLKDRYGSGYVVNLTLGPNGSAAEVDKKMAQRFGVTALKGSTDLVRRFELPSTQPLAEVFRVLETEEWGVETYSVAQAATLQQVFVMFATNMHDGAN